jgi:signal transduction histidine kinase
MDKIKYSQRLKALFADMERLAASPAANSPEIRTELESLRARLLALEAEFLESAKRISSLEEQPTLQEKEPGHRTPEILYDRDQVGFVYTGNKLELLQDAPSVAADKDQTLTALLTASGRTIGEMQIGQPANRALSPEEQNLAQSVAQQVSLQIQNLRLLAATERARADAEAATRRFMHVGWEDYLDAIHHNERVGYAYDQDSVSPYTEQLPANSGYRVSMDVMDEQIGSLYLKTDPAHPLSDDEKDLVGAVARQISQQVENLRLLADASRARAEAEDVTRRMTREGWRSFTDEQEDTSLSFSYDSNQVIPTQESDMSQTVNLSQLLTVNGENIGELSVIGGQSLSPEAASLAASVAAQVSIQIETIRLTEELRKRAAELQELDRLKSAFLANMSHELRTPLNSILGFADVILEGLDGPLTDNMNNDLQLIQKNGRHLLHLINDVLDMAKITAGRMNLNPERFKIHEIFDEVMNITSPQANEKALPLSIEKGSDENAEVFADRTRISQVMINVVNNALKFTDKGMVRLHVKCQGENILIRVQDTGVGIPSDKLEAVFQEFTQVDTSSTRKAGGTGLGLPISRKLIEMHGGRMWAESTGIPGEGTSLFVELPIEAKITEPVEKQEK